MNEPRDTCRPHDGGRPPPPSRVRPRSVRLAAAAVASVLVPGAGAAQLPSVGDLMAYLDDLYRSESSHALMTMTVERPRGTRELRLESWSRGDDEALIVILEPARERGTATLRTEEGLWNYAPRADRLIRIPACLLADSWMGSHFTNDDLVRETSYLDDYQASLEPVEVDGRGLLRATLIPRPGAPVVYTRLVFYVDREAWLPVRTEYYDEDELMRIMRFSDPMTLDGRVVPLMLTLEPADASGERTVVRYETLEFDVDLDEDLFTRRGLRRVARD